MKESNSNLNTDCRNVCKCCSCAKHVIVVEASVEYGYSVDYFLVGDCCHSDNF